MAFSIPPVRRDLCAQPPQVLPGVEPLVMAVGPVNAEGVVADELQLIDLDRRVDPVGVDNPLAGDFIDAAGTHALSSQLDEIELRLQSVAPRHEQGLLGGESLNGGGWGSGFHQILRFRPADSPAVGERLS